MNETSESQQEILSRPLLDKISSPADLRQLSLSELEQLCSELREELIQTLSKIGGHFASSLGATELTVGLHKVFNTPEDLLVWDVGHQAYIHKILTGRRKKLSGIRRFGGISGFPSRNESPYDCFGVAHAGTSISAATGFMEAICQNSEDPENPKRRAVAIIGDGGITSGMAFEALNHAGQLHKKLIVILNDNEMSIAPNVGALSWAFSKTVTSKLSTTTRKHFKNLVEKKLIPQSFYRFLDRAEEATQGFLSTPAMLFESFGFRYIGPIDGNNISQVIDALERAKEQDGPVLIHALTVKGKGYLPAENDPVTYHGVGPFNAGNGKITKSNSPKVPSYTKVFGETLVELCKQDPRIVAITAAMPDGTGLNILQNEMPERVYDVGIAEQHAVTFAAALACEGMRPVCSIYSTFLQRAYDQVIHDVCIQNLPVIFVLDRAGLVGADGPTHHGVFDISYLRALPNMTIMSPKNEIELRDMLLTAINHTKGPIALRYPRGEAIGLDTTRPPKNIKVGQAEVTRTGKDVLLVGLGNTVVFAEAAAEILEENYGIYCSVLNSRFVKPLDQKIFNSEISKHDLVITIEDHSTTGGLGSAVLEFAADHNLLNYRNFIRLGVPDKFIEHGTQAELYKLCGYDISSIVKTVLSRKFSDQKIPANY